MFSSILVDNTQKALAANEPIATVSPKVQALVDTATGEVSMHEGTIAKTGKNCGNQNSLNKLL